MMFFHRRRGAKTAKPLFASARRIAAVLASAVALGWSAGAFAQNDPRVAPPESPLSGLANTFKFRTDPDPAADWVVKTRRPASESNYLPTGAAARTEPAPAMTLERARQIERQLDGERTRHDRLSRRKPAPAAKRSVAPEPVRKAEPKGPDCVLTCRTPIGAVGKR